MDAMGPKFDVPFLHTDFSDERYAELRRFVRVSLQTPALFHALHETGDRTHWQSGTLLDLSGGGGRIAVRSVHSVMAADTPAVLRFRLGAEYVLDAHIVWTDAGASHTQYGLRWINIPPGQQEQLMWSLMRIAVHRKRTRSTPPVSHL